MALQVNVVNDAGGTVRIVLKGRFDFNSQRLFRASYDAPLNNHDQRSIELDMGGVEYLDSSALGMLLLLKERALAADKHLTLTNCQGTVRQVLEVANFHRLFSIK